MWSLGALNHFKHHARAKSKHVGIVFLADSLIHKEFSATPLGNIPIPDARNE